MMVIPYIESEDDVQRHRRRVKLARVVSLVFLMVTILLVHFLVMPLGVIWDRLALMAQRL
jgi:hypothetical protein